MRAYKVDDIKRVDLPRTALCHAKNHCFLTPFYVRREREGFVRAKRDFRENRAILLFFYLWNKLYSIRCVYILFNNEKKKKEEEEALAINISGRPIDRVYMVGRKKKLTQIVCSYRETGERFIVKLVLAGFPNL